MFNRIVTLSFVVCAVALTVSCAPSLSNLQRAHDVLQQSAETVHGLEECAEGLEQLSLALESCEGKEGQELAVCAAVSLSLFDPEDCDLLVNPYKSRN